MPEATALEKGAYMVRMKYDAATKKATYPVELPKWLRAHVVHPQKSEDYTGEQDRPLIGVKGLNGTPGVTWDKMFDWAVLEAEPIEPKPAPTQERVDFLAAIDNLEATATNNVKNEILTVTGSPLLEAIWKAENFLRNLKHGT